MSIFEDKMHISAHTTKLKIKNILGSLKCLYPFLVSYFYSPTFKVFQNHLIIPCYLFCLTPEFLNSGTIDLFDGIIIFFCCGGLSYAVMSWELYSPHKM